MTDYYRVTIERMTPDADGDLMGKTVGEFMGPSEQLARFVPGAVAEALGAERVAVTTVMPQDAPTTFAEPRDADEQPAPAPAAEAPKRKRRTKAEIAADTEAQSLGYRDAAHRAEAEQPAPEAGAEEAAVGAAAGAMQQCANSAPAEAGYTTPDGPAPASTPVAEGRPYNPFV